MSEAPKPSRTLTFYGASDDLFECYDSAERATEEIGCYDRPGIYKVTLGDDGLFIVGHYAPGSAAGCWMVGVMQLDEDRPFPAWPITITAEGYSAVLRVTVPDDVECLPHDR